MHMKKAILIIVAVVAVLAIALTCVSIYFVNTPEYTLMKMQKSVQEEGLEGLMPYLTEDAKTTLGTMGSLVDNNLVGSLMGLLGQEDYLGTLKSELESVQWELNDILKSKNKATVTLNFQYDTKLAGTLEFVMIRQDGWKIDELKMPDFETIDLFS